MTHFPLFPTAYWAEHSAQRTAIVWEKGEDGDFSSLPTSLTWQEVDQLVRQVAQQLQDHGIRQGEMVAYNDSHRLIGLLCYCATIALGGQILMLNPQLTDLQRQSIVADYAVARVISEHDFANFWQKKTACLPAFDSLAPATLTLTSGSSGSSKVVVHSAQNHLDNATGVCELMNFRQTDSWLLSLPLFHVSGQGIVWRWLSQRATLVVNTRKERFFECLAQVSHASLVPTQLQRYLARQKPPMPVAQKILLGGSAIPAELVSAAQKQGITTYSGYGMTEMASTICAKEQGLKSVGKPLHGRELKLVEGEIWVKGMGLALGYLQKNQKIRPLVNAEGWFQTKDLGRWNEHGELVVLGRLDNMFISGGENIQPEEVERVIFASGLVEQAFVLPKPDVEFGQRAVAMVQFKSNEFAKNVKKLTAWLSDKVEKFKQPVAYFPLETAKEASAGEIKLSRRVLAQQVAQLGISYET